MLICKNGILYGTSHTYVRTTVQTGLGGGMLITDEVAHEIDYLSRVVYIEMIYLIR